MPAFPGGDSTLLTSSGGSYYLSIPTGQTASIVLTQVGRVCRIINGATVQTGVNVIFTDPDTGIAFFTAVALAVNAIVDLQFPPSKGRVTISFSAATAGPLTVTLV
jgi:hypothetical protein